MKNKINKNSGFRVFVFMEEKMFIAQCLEHDICVQAHDLETLKDRMCETLSVELKYAKETGISIPPAPDYVQKQWILKEPSYVQNQRDIKEPFYVQKQWIPKKPSYVKDVSIQKNSSYHTATI